ncbi:hypothetical protein RchiOBHm_Chr2g0127831 [Rosa chinensis]|uniref:Uncharacterized protein n=1 Tax=Rosa chinensis TaxID=74649 RepID=A0A2P6RU55_ROSCH|nr:hypothetical protein RchiOBHm_Chr2g0127831 [Rosa chinensis]
MPEVIRLLKGRINESSIDKTVDGDDRSQQPLPECRWSLPLWLLISLGGLLHRFAICVGSYLLWFGSALSISTFSLVIG